VRLPKECRFEGTGVHIKRTRSGVLLIQKKTTPGQVEAPRLRIRRSTGSLQHPVKAADQAFASRAGSGTSRRPI